MTARRVKLLRARAGPKAWGKMATLAEFSLGHAHKRLTDLTNLGDLQNKWERTELAAENLMGQPIPTENLMGQPIPRAPSDHVMMCEMRFC